MTNVEKSSKRLIVPRLLRFKILPPKRSTDELSQRPKIPGRQIQSSSVLFPMFEKRNFQPVQAKPVMAKSPPVIPNKPLPYRIRREQAEPQLSSGIMADQVGALEFQKVRNDIIKSKHSSQADVSTIQLVS